MSATSSLTPGWKLLLSGIAIIAALDFGCSSSSLTNEWRDPEFKSSPLTNMLVVAAKHNPVDRRLWEDEIVAALSSYGVNSGASYRDFPDSIPDPDQVGTLVKEQKFDGVIFIRRLPTQISTTYLPGQVKREEHTEYDPRTQSYRTFYRDVQEAGTTDTNRIVRQQVVVFAAGATGGRMVWAGTGELINPASRDEVRNELTGLIVPELSQQGIIPGKK